MESRKSSPNRRRRRRATLLSADAKREFFDHLDAFLSSGRGARRSDDTQPRAGEHSTPRVMTNYGADMAVPMGRGAHTPSHRERHATAAVDDQQTENHDMMARGLPTTSNAAPASGTKRRASLPAADALKRGKTRATKSLDTKSDSAQLVLHGQRVLLVPIGSDVSRKRLEIWADMVVALGGTVVTPTQNNKTHQQHHAQLLHLHHQQTSPSNATNRGDPFDWRRVDIAIVSTQVDAAKLLQHYQLSPDGLPAQLKLVTPEWLTHVRQEKNLPEDTTLFEWRHAIARIQQVQQEGEQQQKQQEEEAREKASAVDDDEGSADEDDDGSDRKNLTTHEIVRAPPVRIDEEKFRREEQELQEKKKKLVNERIPIFHQLNPRFKTIANANEGQKLKMEAFVCQKSSLMQANLNAHLTDPLEELMEFLHVERDTWREYSYKKIVSSLKAMNTRVSSVRDLKGLWWAKGRMRDKVVEVLETGKLEKLEAKKINPRLRTLVEISRIWGVGPATAAKLYNMGYKTMDALRENSDQVLSSQQQIGLKHYEDFMTKIPRSEVQEIEKTVVDEIHRLVPNATALACGSYRRGKLSSGDVDILITDPDSEECDILPELLRRLHASGFLTDDLTHISDHHMGRCDSYMGVCRLRDGLPFRRLDIKVYPRRYFGFALLYFTGSDHFNRSMRLFARKKGWSLSDRYLKPVVRVRKGVKLEAGESVVCPEEVDVFIALGLEYKDPTERNCFDIRFLEEDEALAKGRKSNASVEGDTTAVATSVADP